MTISGDSVVTTPGNKWYTACAANLFYLSYDGAIFFDGEPETSVVVEGASLCWQNYIYVGYSTDDFEVYAAISDYPGFGPTIWSDTIHVSVELPLAAHIAGDEDVAPEEECAWQAIVDGGTPPYTYSWWGALTGSNKNLFGELSESSYLYLQVTDADSTTVSDQILIDVDESYECEW